jgi:hypothetical protein
VLLLLGVCLSAAGNVQAGEGNAHLLGGVRTLDNQFWRPVDDQFVGGVQVDFGGSHWPLHLQTGLHRSEEDHRRSECFILCNFGGVEVKGEIWELSFGVLKMWRKGNLVRPFAGGGMSVLDAELRDNTTRTKAEDRSPGVYASGGVLWRREDSRISFNTGFEGKILLGSDLRFPGREGNADYLQLAFLIGLGW